MHHILNALLELTSIQDTTHLIMLWVKE